MNLFSIAFRNLSQNLNTTVLTVLSVFLGTSLVFLISSINQQTQENFGQTSTGIDLIIASKGSPLQTTLNTLYHLETSTGVIPYSLYETAKSDPRMEFAFPFYVGDQYAGYRVVGTSVDFLQKGKPRGKETFSLAKGKHFEFLGEAVLGASVAVETGLKVGDEFFFTHGLAENAGFETKEHDEHPARVVGILNKSYTANDRVIFTAVESIEAIHQNVDHDDHEHHDHDHENIPLSEIKVNNVDAVLLKMKNPALALQLAGTINYPTPTNPVLAMNMRRDPFFRYKTEIMAVIPATQISALMGIVGQVERILSLLTILIVIVALIGTLVALTNTMEQRKKDISVMRALGAHKNTVFSIIVIESMFIVLLGTVLGWGFSHIFAGLLSETIASKTGVVVDGFYIMKDHLYLGLTFVLAGAAIGIIPGIKAYRTQVLTYLNR